MIRKLGDAWWNETLRIGGIEPAYRPRLEGRLRQRMDLDGDEDLAARKSARKDIRRLISTVTKVVEISSRLEQNREFLNHNRLSEAEQEVAVFRGHREQSVAALNCYIWEKRRLSRRAKKDAEVRDLGRFYVDVMEIWAEARGVDAPFQAAETLMTGKFHEFLERLTRATEPRLSKAGLQEKSKRARELMAKEFCRRRALRARRRDHSRRHCRSDADRVLGLGTSAAGRHRPGGSRRDRPMR